MSNLNRLLLACLLTLCSILPAEALSVLPLYLDDIIDTAAIAFQGRCIGNRVERDAQTGLVVTYTSFQVEDVLKGQTGSSHTIKQIGGRLADDASGVMVHEIEGVPRFVPGQRYIVFLNDVSAAGFSSPVGLGQGRFDVLQDASGPQITNGRDFRQMTANKLRSQMSQSVQSKLEQTSSRIEQLGLDEFKQLVRQQTGAAK